MILLGIETSCDETGAALVRNGRILADRTTTQLLHQKYGGVVPELASRAHEKLLMNAVESVLVDSALSLADINAVAATYGPGLAGALLVGVSFAKGMAYGLGVPFLGVNHLEAHLWVPELTFGKMPLPFLGMIVSGGHTITIGVKRLGEYELIGTTHDDAAGELFDKVGRMLGFGFPAGAAIDDDAFNFNGETVRFPRAHIKNDQFGFSFSGLKTAVLYYLREKYGESPNGYQIPQHERCAISAGIMEAVSEMLITGLEAAWSTDGYRVLAISGGVAASRYLRERFRSFAEEKGIQVYIPPPKYCTDNGAMTAYTGYLHLQSNHTSSIDLSNDPAGGISLSRYPDLQL